MGGGRFDEVTYASATKLRRATNTKDFAYSDEGRQSNTIHPNLDPKRINSKPFSKLESRDSDEHPNSTAVLVCFDVTGSNISRAQIAQQNLPKLMGLLTKYLPDPQVAIAANDDFKVKPKLCVQISDFESDNRVDEHLRNTILVSDGGGNSGESYDLLLYAAARKTVLDCAEKRKRKGYMFMYADEPLMTKVDPREVNAVFGDSIQGSIPIETIIKEARELYHVFLISTVVPLYGAAEQYEKLFGSEYVLTLQNPNMICELIGSVIGMKEANLTDADAVRDLVAAGTSAEDAKILVGSTRRKIQMEDAPAST